MTPTAWFLILKQKENKNRYFKELNCDLNFYFDL